MNDKEFIGRDKEIEEFKEFLIGERPNWGGRGKGAPLLLVVGDQGIGKRSLLQAMAQQANDQKHYVFPRDVYKTKDFDEQIRNLIAMVERKKRLNLGKATDWFKVSIAALAIPAPGVANITNVLLQIYEEHKKAGYDENYLAQMLYSALSKLDRKIRGAERIVILLYPKTESPVGLIPLLEYISMVGVPPKVHFVIAQRPQDVVIEAARKREPEELRKICAEPMNLGKMNDEESLQFIDFYDTERKLNETMKKVFLERYGGWPYLMKLGLDELQKVEGEVTEEIIRNLPSDVREFWSERYEKVVNVDSRNFLQTVNLLPHPYLYDDVALFAKLEPDSMELASSAGSPVWQLLDRMDYYELFSRKTWEDCPFPKHPTTKEYVVDRLKAKDKPLYHKRLNNIVSHYEDKIGDDFEKADVDRDALAYLFPHMMEVQSWDKIGKLLANIGYLKRKQEPEEQRNFQDDFIDLLNNEEIPNNKLINILEGVLNAICEQLQTSKEKADWLDTFAYWINEFGVKDDTERSLALKDVARKFDYACGDLSKELAEAYLKKGENSWALRFAELCTWVYQRAGDYNKCTDACRYAEEMCLQEGMEDAYRHLGQAEFIRMRAYALMTLSKIVTDESKKTEYEAKAHEAYEELNKVFPAEGGENQWPRIKEWEELEEHLERNTDKVLPPPSQTGSGQPRAFRAKVVSNLDDCISAMHIIQFFEKYGGWVEWIHHKEFEPEQFAPKDTLFTVLLGGPKAPGISKVAYEFSKEDNKESFLRMYSGLYFEANRLQIKKGKTECYMLGGISKVNTLMAAYEFTKDAEVMQIIKKGQPVSS